MKKIASFFIALVLLVSSQSVYSVSAGNNNNKVIEKVGYIAAVYDYAGIRYAVVDFAEFLNTDQVIKRSEVKAQALKDGSLQKENGKYFIYDDYYIYNPVKTLATFNILTSADLRMIDYNSSNVVAPKKVDYNTFKKQAYTNCRIYKVGIKNNQIVYAYAIYTP